MFVLISFIKQNQLVFAPSDKEVFFTSLKRWKMNKVRGRALKRNGIKTLDWNGNGRNGMTTSAIKRNGMTMSALKRNGMTTSALKWNGKTSPKAG